MKKSIRLALITGACFLGLAFAAPAFSAYNPSLIMEQSSYKVGGATTADVFIAIDPDADPTAKLTIFSPIGYTANLTAAPGTKIGTVVARVKAKAIAGALLTLAGDVLVANPADPAIQAAAPVTFSLVFGAAVLWVIGAIGIGLLMVTFKGTFVDPLLMVLALIGISMPVFWLGEVVNLITQDRLHDTVLFSWVPPLGYTPFTQDPWQWFLHLIFPWITLSILYIGFYARVLRADLLEVQNDDFVRTAKAKGLSPRSVLVRHMLRTSLITFVSLFALDFGVLVGGGALLTEVVFGLPGVGLLTYNSLRSLDLPVIMATVIYGAFFITIMSALVDIVYARLDPRIRPA